jgi:hypothetical protein
MAIARRHFGLCVYGGELYLSGGVDRDDAGPLATVERCAFITRYQIPDSRQQITGINIHVYTHTQTHTNTHAHTHTHTHTHTRAHAQVHSEHGHLERDRSHA